MEVILAFGCSVGFGVLLEEIEGRSFFGWKFGSFRNLVHGGRWRHFRQQLNATVVLQTGTGGNEPAHDDVFLEPAEIIDLARHRSLGEDARGFLEARGRDKRVGRERSLSDTQEQRTSGCRTPTFGDDAIVFFAEAELVDLLFEQEGSVSHIFNLYPTHHLAGNGFDVFVVDVHALEAVNLLNGVHEIGLREFLAENREQVMQVERAVNQSLAGFNVIAFLNVDVNTTRDGIFLGGFAVFGFDENLAHTLDDVTILDVAVDFADDGRVFGLAGFEEFDDARETAGDVLGLGGFTRNFREHVTSLHLVAILDHQVGAGRHEVLLANLTRRGADKNGGLVFFVTWRQRDDVL